MNTIDIVFFIQGNVREKIERMFTSVLKQKISYLTKWIVYGVVCENMDRFFAGKGPIHITPSYSIQNDYAKIARNLTGDYFTIITDEEEWTDEDYLRRAIDFLEEELQFSMYCSNTYDKKIMEHEYDLHSIHCDGLYDLWYQKYINYGIDDFFYHLALDKNIKMFIIPQAIVYRKYKDEYGSIFDNLEIIVYKSVTLRQMLYFENLKHGMSLLAEETVANAIIDKNSRWKQNILYAMILYAVKDIYKEKNPRWISEYINFEYFLGIKRLREEMKKGFVPSAEEIEQMAFMNRIVEKLPKGSPLMIKSFGEKNPDKIYLILEFERRGYGLFATVFSLLGAFEYAKKNGLIPIVDFKNYYVKGFQSSKRRFVENSWEYYFEQPVTGVGLEEVYESKNVMVCDEYGWCNPIWYDLLPTDTKTVIMWNQIMHEFLRLQPEVQQYVDECYNRILAGKTNVLGVSIRAGFIRSEKAESDLITKHPVQIELTETIEMIKMYMQEWNCDWIFLVADDIFYFHEIKNLFKERCLYLERKRGKFFYDKDLVADVKQVTSGVLEQGIVENNIDYICETYLLAQCNSLFAGNCGCSRMAYFLNNNQYEHVEIIDKGKY